MKKILFIILGFSALIASSSGAYYFLIFVPQKESRELELSRQKFKYQLDKDANEKKERELKELQNNIKYDEKTAQDNWNRARAECITIANRNLDSLVDFANNSCETELCQNNVMANKELQNFGAEFIENCTKNRL